MISVRFDFTNRKREIEVYIYYLKLLTMDNAQIVYEENLIDHKKDISDTMQKIMIANTFLLLYNLIESTMKNSFEEIYDKISLSEIMYLDLTEEIKKIWISQCLSNLRQGEFKIDTLRNNIMFLVDDILNNHITLDKTKFEFSGNLSGDKIKNLAGRYGFSVPTKSSENLNTVMNKRNHLSHGDFTFSEVGQDYTLNDLEIYKNDTFEFLEEVINKIEDFILNRKFIKFKNNFV